MSASTLTAVVIVVVSAASAAVAVFATWMGAREKAAAQAIDERSAGHARLVQSQQANQLLGITPSLVLRAWKYPELGPAVATVPGTWSAARPYAGYDVLGGGRKEETGGEPVMIAIRAMEGAGLVIEAEPLRRLVPGRPAGGSAAWLRRPAKIAPGPVGRQPAFAHAPSPRQTRSLRAPLIFSMTARPLQAIGRRG